MRELVIMYFQQREIFMTPSDDDDDVRSFLLFLL